MFNKSTTHTLLFLSVILSLPVYAQRKSAPDNSSYHSVVDSARLGRGLMEHIDGIRELTWTLFTTPTTQQTLTLPLSFDRAGGIEKITDNIFLIAGWDSLSGQGYLQHFYLDWSVSPIIVSLGETAYSTIDPYDIVWDEKNNLLYVWDANSGISTAPLDETVAQPLENSFSLELIPSVCAGVANPAALEYTLNRARKQDGVHLIPFPRHHQHGTDRFPRFHLVFENSGWNVVPWSSIDISQAAVEAAGYKVKHASFVPTAGPLYVKGPAGPFNVVDVDSGATVFVGNLTSDPGWWGKNDNDLNTWQAITLPQDSLISGNSYELQSVHGDKRSAIFLPLHRVGRGESQEDNGVTWHLRQGQINGWSAFVGNSNFSLGGRFDATPNADGRRVDFFTTAAVQPPNAPEVSIDIGNGRFALNPALSVVLGTTTLNPMDGRTIRWPLQRKLPIPLDPLLAGTRIHFQHIVITGTKIMASDVFGVTIRPAP